MLKLVVATCVVCSTLTVWSQSEVHSEVLENYSKKEMKIFNQLSKEDKSTLYFAIESGVQYNVTIPAKKEMTFDGIVSVEQVTNNATFLDLGLRVLTDRTQYFRIGNTDKMIVIPSLRRLAIERRTLNNIK